MITKQQKELIKATVPILKEHGVALTSHFYKRMFSHNPELKNVFNMGNQQSGKQQMSLAMAVLAYAENIEDPSVLINAVTKIGHKHKSLDIRPEHYAIVGNHLLSSIKEVLGDGASAELLEAWGVAYNQLADILIGLEDGLYKEAVSKEGGWTGWRPFNVKKKVKESDEITSFYLYPSDGGKVADFTPGQYLSIRLYLPELNLFQPRQYSISSAPNGEYYRISVKKEPAKEICPEGMVSNELHNKVKEGDILEVSSPAGDFVLDIQKDTPLVFISGGVGQTPFISMLEHIAKNNSKKDITWIHGCRNSSVHAFKELTDKYTEEIELNTKYFYENLDQAGKNCNHGLINISELKEEIVKDGANYYICGPAPFIEKVHGDLTSIGVNKEAIHYEEFGPANLFLN
ncbi:NO-inducible flavohemoprotein [Cytophagaceae bacterium ABcell3]|nr:NO-inducible flavohemoprotein [Cytophagaceae bacterium ABcell3]